MFDFLFWIWRPLLEILFIWALIYYVIRFFQGTRAVQVLVGLIVLAIIFNIAKFLELNTINWVLTKLFAVGVLAILIIFQPELRRALARIGQNAIAGSFLKHEGLVDELVSACEHLAKNRIGAIIAIEREMGLRNYIESGILLDSKVSAELLISLFTQNTPTHDGGVIIQGDRIAACGSLFPLSQNTALARSLGTRHRASIGLSEETDAVCIVVSEETGTISTAVYGELTRDLDGESLAKMLQTLFKPEEDRKVTWRDIFSKKSWQSLFERNS